MSDTTPELDGPPVEIVAGREPPPFTQAPDWVTYADISAEAKTLHTVLKSHMNQKRGSTHVWPTTRALARILGLSRPDKVSPLLKELKAINAVEVSGYGMPRRNIYVVHSMPDDGYEGPLTVKDWYDRNREAMAEAKAVDDAKRAARKTSKAQVSAVTPDTGQLPVTPNTGQHVDLPEGQHVDLYTGGNNKEEQQDVSNKETPVAGATAAAAAQMTIDGEDEKPAVGRQRKSATAKKAMPAKEPRTPTDADEAFGIAGDWMKFWSDKGTPIVAANPKMALKCLVLPALTSGYTVLEIKKALFGLDRQIPTKNQLGDALVAVRQGLPVGRSGANGRRDVVESVNDQWKAKEARGEAPVFSHEGVPVQTEGAGW